MVPAGHAQRVALGAAARHVELGDPGEALRSASVGSTWVAAAGSTWVNLAVWPVGGRTRDTMSRAVRRATRGRPGDAIGQVRCRAAASTTTLEKPVRRCGR